MLQKAASISPSSIINLFVIANPTLSPHTPFLACWLQLQCLQQRGRCLSYLLFLESGPNAVMAASPGTRDFRKQHFTGPSNVPENSLKIEIEKNPQGKYILSSSPPSHFQPCLIRSLNRNDHIAATFRWLGATTSHSEGLIIFLLNLLSHSYSVL